MRVRVDFSIEKLPIIHRHSFIALIKEALRNSNISFKESLYPESNFYNTKITKPFTFSIYYPPVYEVRKEKFYIEKDWIIEEDVLYFKKDTIIFFFLSTNSYDFFANFYNGIIKLKEFCIGDSVLRLKNIFMLKEREIRGEKVNFITRSPILIEDKNEEPLLPQKSKIDSFLENFNTIHNRKFKDLRGYGLKKEINFIPINVKKKVVKHTLRGFREKTGKPIMFLTCFDGKFELNGDIEDLKLLYQIGIGLRTGQGFGMVEAI